VGSRTGALLGRRQGGVEHWDASPSTRSCAVFSSRPERQRSSDNAHSDSARLHARSWCPYGRPSPTSRGDRPPRSATTANPSHAPSTTSRYGRLALAGTARTSSPCRRAPATTARSLRKHAVPKAGMPPPAEPMISDHGRDEDLTNAREARALEPVSFGRVRVVVRSSKVHLCESDYDEVAF